MVKNFSGTNFFCSRALFAAVLFLSICHSVLGAPNFSASLDRATISLGETATLTLTFTEVSSQEAPNLPAVPNLRVVHMGQSSQFQIVNGATSSSVIYTYELAPQAAGDFVIPALQIKAGAKILTSRALKLKVVQGQTPTAPGQKLPAFLKLVVPKTQIYLSETIPVEIQLYYQEARDLSALQLQSDGFTTGNFQQPTQTRTRVENEIYNLAVFKTPVAATKVGSLALGPATCGLKIFSGPRDFFGQFTQTRQVSLRSETQTMQVLPLPEANKPAQFNGAIGNFSMQLSANPTNVAVGDPVTLKIKIAGRGSLDLLSLPSQTEWREFKTYPATSKIESADPLGLEGTKIFEQVVVPQNSEVKELPQFSFSFFDPEKRIYRTLTQGPIPLIVHPAAATPQPTVFSNNPDTAEKPTARDIAPIKPQLGALETFSPPTLRQSWFLVLQSVAPLLWIGSMVYRKRREAFEKNPRLRRQRAVAQIVSRGLKDLSQHAAANDSEKFFAGVFRLLQEQIGERLDLPASAITEAVIKEEFQPLGIDAATVALVEELFQACNQTRYARQRTSEELASFIPKVESAIAYLRKIE